MPLARRAQLAVVAHIRHTYTEYDRILRLTSYPRARALVENRTLCKLVEWRGAGRHGKPELEAVLQEVIVISDDEDEEDEEENIPSGDTSVEVVRAGSLRPNEIQTRPIDVISDSSDADPGSPDNEARPHIKTLRTPRKQGIIQPSISSIQNRRAAWERAMQKYRNIVGQPPAEKPLQQSGPSFEIDNHANHRQESNATAVQKDLGRDPTKSPYNDQIVQSPSKPPLKPPVSVHFLFSFSSPQTQQFSYILLDGL